MQKNKNKYVAKKTNPQHIPCMLIFKFKKSISIIYYEVYTYVCRHVNKYMFILRLVTFFNYKLIIY